MTARSLPQPRFRPALRVVPGRAAAHRRPLAWGLFTAAAVAAFFGLIYSRTALDRTAFQLEELERRIAVQEARYQGVRLEVARLQSPQRVLEAAEEMGLAFPEEVRAVPARGVVGPAGGPGEHWAEVKTVLSAQP